MDSWSTAKKSGKDINTPPPGVGYLNTASHKAGEIHCLALSTFTYVLPPNLTRLRRGNDEDMVYMSHAKRHQHPSGEKNTKPSPAPKKTEPLHTRLLVAHRKHLQPSTDRGLGPQQPWRNKPLTLTSMVGAPNTPKPYVYTHTRNPYISKRCAHTHHKWVYQWVVG